jgi:hypothetical protein
MVRKIKSKNEFLIKKNTFKLKESNGGGILSIEVWGFVLDRKTIVTRYNLAYINHLICQKDNGRVLGFANKHDYHHRHFMGAVEPVDFISYENTYNRFEKEWQEIVMKVKKKTND